MGRLDSTTFCLKNTNSILSERYGKYWSDKDSTWKSWRSEIKTEDWREIKQNISTVMLCVTAKCNSQCNMCFMKYEDMKELKLSEIRYVLAKIGRNKKVILFGGEPTVRSDIKSILKTVTDSGNTPMIYTNGLRFSDLEFARDLRPYIDRVHFSFDGFSEEVYSKLRGDKTQIKKKLIALKNMKELGYQVFLSTTVVPGINENELGSILEFILKNRDLIKGWNILSGMPYGKFEINAKEIWNGVDIVHKLAEVDDVFSLEYFVEFRKLYNNIGKIFLNMRNKAEGYFYHTLFRVDGHRLVPLFECGWLRDLNFKLENGKLLDGLKSLINQPSFARIFLKTLFYGDRLLKDDMITIRPGELSTPVNFDKTVKPSTVCIYKNSDEDMVRIDGTTT